MNRLLSGIKKLWKYRKYARSILKIVYFNFHYLPLKQAIYLPILLYKPKFMKLKGDIKITRMGGVHFGMIELGPQTVSLYPNSGIIFQNNGGTIIFKGDCYIGNNSYISIGEKGVCEFGAFFQATTTFRIVCYHHVQIGDTCSFGWDCMVLDTDFHKLSKLSGGYSKGYGSVLIGAHNWFGNGCLIMKRTETPNYCTISARTILSGKVDVPDYCVIGQTNNIEIKATGIWRNLEDDIILY